MGLVKIKHPDVKVLGETLEENLPFWEARGWSLHDETVVPPKDTARKSAWVDFAVSQGAAEDDAEGMTRAELIDQYGTVDDLHVVDPTAAPEPAPDDEEKI